MADGTGVPPWQGDRTSTSGRLQSLRNLLNSQRRDAALNVLDSELLERSLAEAPTSERSRRSLEGLSYMYDSVAPTEGPQASSSPSSIIRSRRRAFRPSQRLQRQRDSQDQAMRSDTLDSIGDSRRLSGYHTSSDTTTTERISESHINRDQRYRAKRRRLNDGTCDDDSKVVSYGDKGRVIPGPLKLEVVSCDGGEQTRNPTGMPQHVLQDDDLVYCTKENRCNILLKHVGGMPFSLTRIVFKAPKSGYEVPTHEGMLFVAMDDDQLLERTAEYESRYSPRGYRQHHYQRSHDTYRPPQEHGHASLSIPHIPLDRPMNAIRDYHGSSWSRYRETTSDLESSQCSGFEVTLTDPSDDEDEVYAGTSPPRYNELDHDYTARSYADRYRPRARQSQYATWDEVTESSTSDSEGDETSPYPENDNEDIRLIRRRMLHHARYSLERTSPNYMAALRGSGNRRESREWRELQKVVRVRGTTPPPTKAVYNATGSHEGNKPSSSQSTSTGAKTRSSLSTLRSGGSAPAATLAPHARFFLRKTKSGVAVDFDPPVAGRYVLIKLWSSCPNGNINIRSIIASGYGGPRFFPKIELR